jgi:hypothetical protein
VEGSEVRPGKNDAVPVNDEDFLLHRGAGELLRLGEDLGAQARNAIAG